MKGRGTRLFDFKECWIDEKEIPKTMQIDEKNPSILKQTSFYKDHLIKKIVKTIY